MGRSPSRDATGLKRGPWTPEEDQKLLAYIQQHGHGSWRSLPEKAGLQRCGKSCRLRWTNYLRPDIKRGKFSLYEEQTIIQLHALLGNRWSAIAAYLPKRTDNEIKNYWNTHIKKRLAMMGIDPVTHRPKVASLGSAAGDTKNASNLSHMAQWENARLEAEARLAKESKARQNRPTDSSHSRSASARFLNQMATRPRCLDILKAWQNVSFKTFESSINITGDLSGSNKNVFGHGWCDATDVESPTSTLQFCKKAEALSNVSDSFDHMNKNLGICGGKINEGFNICGLDDIVFEASAGKIWTNVGSSEIGADRFLDGFSSVFDNHGNQFPNGGSTSMHDASESSLSHCPANHEENKDYWNDIIDLVSSPVYSPAFSVFQDMYNVRSVV